MMAAVAPAGRLSAEAEEYRAYQRKPSVWVADKINIVPAKRRTQAQLVAWLATQPPDAHQWCRRALAAGRLQLDGQCYQSATLDAMARPGRYAIQWANGTAKTATLALWILWFIETHPGAKIVTTAGTWSQLTMQLWSEIPIWAERAKVPLLSTGRILKTQINIAPDWVCFARGADKAETFEGVHGEYVAIVADEAKAISTDILDGAARRILRGNEGRCWFICLSSPGSPSGYFWDITNGDKSHTWQTMRLSAYESERISLDQIAADAEELGEDSPLFVAMDLGEFPAEGEDTLIPLTHAQAAVGRRVRTDGGNSLGIDVARKGGDYTALVAIHGRQVQAPVTAQGQRTTWTAAQAQQMKRTAAYVRIAVDDTGVGGGVSDMLVMAGAPVSEVNFGASDLVKQSDIYANNKTEMYAWLAKELKAGYEDSLLPEEQQSQDVGLSLPEGNASKRLLNQLCSIRMHFDGRRYKVEGHKELAARGVKSPDEADALALANWARARAGRRYPVDAVALEHGRDMDPDDRDPDEVTMLDAAF